MQFETNNVVGFGMTPHTEMTIFVVLHLTAMR